MANLNFDCPHCSQNLEVDDSAAGMSLECPACNQPVVVPSPETTNDAGRQKVVGSSIEQISNKVESGVSSVISKFVSENQDPKQVATIYEKISGILTKEEVITYISVQNKPIANVQPDAIVLTNRRFIVYHPKLLGRVDFDDHIWRDLQDVKIKEGVVGSTITLKVTNGKTLSLDFLPKPQARRVYSLAQEMEERVLEERRLREIEEKRAAAGGVVIHGNGTPGSGTPEPAKEDPVAVLKQLKEMLDAGLITQGEFESKRQAILSRM